MSKVTRFITVLLVLLGITATTALAQGDNTGLFRFVHVVPGVSEIDVYVDGQVAADRLDYGEASNYISVPAGTREITVRPAGVSTELWSQQAEATPGTPATMVASSIDPPSFQRFEDDFSPVAAGTTRLRIVHAIADGPSVDVSYEGQTVTSGLNYNADSGSFDIPAASYPLTATTPDGAEVVAAQPFNLTSNTSNIVIFYGTPSLPEALQLSAPLAPDGEEFGRLRVAHTVSGAPAVDIYTNDTLLVPNLAFNEVTDHLALPAGDYAVELRAAGTDDSLLQANLTLEDGDALTLAALGNGENLTANVFTDDVSGVDAQTGAVSLINAIPDSTATLTLDDGTTLGDAVENGSAGEVVTLEPTRSTATLSLEVNGETQEIALPERAYYGGVYTNAIAVLDTSGAFPQPTVSFAETRLAQALESVPGTGMMPVAQAEGEGSAMESETVQEATTQPPQPTAAPTQPPQPTAAPTQPPQPTAAPTQPPAVQTPVVAGPTAVVNLNPGANLQLRQYPSSTAKSLGLAPANTVLQVNGREGAEVTPEGEQINEDYVDPVTQLEDPDADLNPEETWLNVTYQTPDGGQITAWVNALYVNVRDQEGELLPLRELDTVPGNQAGEAEDTDITPPPVPEDRVTITVIGLNPGVNLNIRRTPNTAGEVLGGIPNGAVAELVGVNENAEWAFIDYQPAEGGQITGWVSAQFVEYGLNGETVDLAELEMEEVLEIIPEDRRGEISSDAPTVVAPTEDPTQDAYVATVQLNPGANLNLRRDPVTEAEVVARIPSGTQVIVEGRSENGLWLRTTYEGVQGWIAEQFVTLTFNDDLVEVEEVPVIEGVEGGDI